MPFIGRDWRSPGEAWVKTEALGWQRMKIIESQLHPPACHQYPACSWPPRSEFGQHMAENCHESPRLSDNQPSVRCIYGRNSLSSDEKSSDSDSSPAASPTDTPEKRHSTMTTPSPCHNMVNLNHLNPIIISSPYGQYSCCGHHHHLQPSDQAPDVIRCPRGHRSITRSLSPDPPRVASSSPDGRPIRYNRSVSDFRGSSTSPSSDSSSSSSASDTSSVSSLSPPLSPNMSRRAGEQQSSHAQQVVGSAPLIMKNGSRLVESEFVGGSDHRQQQQPLACATCCSCNQETTTNFSSPHHQQTKESSVKTAPHCRISVRTREVAMYNTISEAFYRLDFCNAIHDIRRFNYICKLLHLLITQNLTSLSGCATRVLFNMLEQVAREVSSNKRNIHVLRNLLNELRQTIQKYYCWGRPIGSTSLWQQHFDTIERISRIVDGIELSQPKDDSKARFENLPVEMVREILLRLNDYRDLVNSAQASPVMRSMIDSQYIWKRLCRYHFTEQQLESAFSNRDMPLVKRVIQRGIKYARTASADGKGSFRNPIEHSNTSSIKSKRISGSGNGSKPLTVRQQIEQTSGRRRRNSQETTTVGQKPETSSSSHVTKTIQKFDKTNAEAQPSSSQASPSNGNTSNSKVDSKATTSAESASKKDGHRIGDSQQQPPVPSFSSTNRPGRPEIDWERVFHQLRKKYDLKEEYADCLLLCRHCRCLFWKSFGHPCIINEEDEEEESMPSGVGVDQSQQKVIATSRCHPSCYSANICNCDRHQPAEGSAVIPNQALGANQGQTPTSNNNNNQDRSAGPSVALLSRNFDNRAQGVASESASAALAASGAPISSTSSAAADPAERQAIFPANNRRVDDPQANDQSANARVPLRDLNAQLLNNRIRNNLGHNEIQRPRNNNADNSSSPRPSRRRDDLVPKHVTITPQAFLKFFSL